MLNAEVDLLRRVPLFAGIESSRLKLLAYTSDVVTYQASQVLFKKGDVGDAAYVIIKGDAEVIIASDDGAEIPIAVLHDGDFVGEIAILCDTPRTATVRAKGELKALTHPQGAVLRTVASVPRDGGGDDPAARRAPDPHDRGAGGGTAPEPTLKATRWPTRRFWSKSGERAEASPPRPRPISSTAAIPAAWRCAAAATS